jgi:hypothetical protein
MCATCGCMGKKKPAKKATAKKAPLSPKQQKIAGKAKPTNKITGADFKAMKKAK